MIDKPKYENVCSSLAYFLMCVYGGGYGVGGEWGGGLWSLIFHKYFLCSCSRIDYVNAFITYEIVPLHLPLAAQS